MKLWQSILALTAFWAALYLPGLGRHELKGEEGRRILPAIEMLETGDWVLPSMEGQPYLRKPPLINWAIASSMHLTGRRDEWSARLPSTLAVLALALVGGASLGGLVAGVGASSPDRAKMAFMMGLLLLVNAGLMEKGRLAEIEATYVALTGIAMALWMNFWRREASPWLTYTVPWVALGLGLLAKGPPHLLFFYGVVGAVLWKDRRLRELRHPAHLAGVAIMLACFLPWAIAVKHRAGVVAPTVQTGATWWEQLTDRFGFAQFSLVNWLLSPLEAVAMLLPWGLVLVAFWRRLPSTAIRLGGRDTALVLGLRWAVVATAAAILLVPTTRARFAMPLMLPALTLSALILRHELPPRWQSAWRQIGLAVMVALSIAGLVAPLFVPALRESRINCGLAALATGGAVLAVWRCWTRFSRIAPPVSVVLPTALAAVLLSTIYAASVAPGQRTTEDTRPVGARLSMATGGHPLVIINGGRHPTPLHWRFYLTCPHVVVQRLSDVPADANYLLVPTRLSDDPALRERLTERMGFKRKVIQITDALDNSFALWSRLPAEVTEPDPTAPAVRLHSPAP